MLKPSAASVAVYFVLAPSSLALAMMSCISSFGFCMVAEIWLVAVSNDEPTL